MRKTRTALNVATSTTVAAATRRTAGSATAGRWPSGELAEVSVPTSTVRSTDRPTPVKERP